MTNKWKTVLYTGVTSDLPGRLTEHKERVYPKSFTARYNLDQLVYFEGYHSIEEAIKMEKFIKGKNRSWKNALISKANPLWKDLSSEVMAW